MWLKGLLACWCDICVARLSVVVVVVVVVVFVIVVGHEKRKLGVGDCCGCCWC